MRLPGGSYRRDQLRAIDDGGESARLLSMQRGLMNTNQYQVKWLWR